MHNFSKKETIKEEKSHGSLDSLLQESGSSVDSSPQSLGSSMIMQKLNIFKFNKIKLGEKKLTKGKSSTIGSIVMNADDDN